jgi:hypothetical protein
VSIEYVAKTTAYRVCAWCDSLLGVKSWPSPWEESTITHGICEPCTQQLRNQTASPLSALGEAERWRGERNFRAHESLQTH